MGEPASDQVSDGNQMSVRSIPTSLRFGNLDASVSCRDAAVGELRVEGIENSLPMGFDDRRNLLQLGSSRQRRAQLYHLLSRASASSAL